MGSLFMPDHFVAAESTLGDIKITSLAWGFQLGFTFLTAAKAGTQTLKIWRRTRRVTGYMFMIWVEVIVNTILGVLSWLYMDGIIPPSFAYFMTAVTLWCIELHLLIQIIVNRLSLLIVSRRRAAFIKWGSCGVILAINIGVYCIWIPARLQISQTYIDINNIFDRIEKVIYLILDAALNFYFCYLVKTKLVSAGMTKYVPLYKFNTSIVFVSLAMDVLLIGIMSMPNQLIYVQFHPLCFMVKLNIEMSMAHMISKIARAPGQGLSNSGDVSHSANVKLSGVDGSGGGTGGSKQKSLAGTTVVGNGIPLRDQKEMRFDPTISEILGEDRTDGKSSNQDRVYHAWVSGGMSSPMHDARGRPMQRHDRSRAGDVEAGISVVNRPGGARDNTGVITKATTVHVTTESVINDESSIDRGTRAPSEADSMKGLTRKHSS